MPQAMPALATGANRAEILAAKLARIDREFCTLMIDVSDLTSGSALMIATEVSAQLGKLKTAVNLLCRQSG